MGRSMRWVVTAGAFVALALSVVAVRFHYKTRTARVALESEQRELDRLEMRLIALSEREAEGEPEPAPEAEKVVDASVLGVLNRLEEYARVVGVRCTEIAQPPDMMPKTRVFRVNGMGPPAAVAAFLARLEDDRGPLAVQSLRVYHEERRTCLFEATVISPKGRGTGQESRLDEDGA